MTPLELAAKRAYESFLFALPAEYRPIGLPLAWEAVPEVLKEAWKAAAAGARESR